MQAHDETNMMVYFTSQWLHGSTKLEINLQINQNTKLSEVSLCYVALACRALRLGADRT